MKLDKKTITILLGVSIAGPIAVNILMFIPSFGLAAIGTESWLGFFGNYSGGIVGGIVAYIIAKSQIDHEKEERKAEEQEKESFAYILVQTFLFEELRSNLNKIPQSVMSSLLSHVSGNLNHTQRWGHEEFTYDIYNEIKFEIAKYRNPIVGETIQVYHKLREFERVTEINKLTKAQALVYYNHFSNWKEKLGE